MANLATLESFIVTQKLTLMVNRYEIRTVGPDGKPGELVAFAQQKRLAFKEQVTFYADERREVALFGYKARQRLDLGATYDVTDADGNPIGWFRKDFAKSLLSSSWHVGQAGDPVEYFGTERNQTIAVLRRIWSFIPILNEVPVPFLFHFDFTAPDGQFVLRSTKAIALRDRYHVEVPGGRIDRRVAAAMAVALDALQHR
jgi:uncharacterized protein YxjI